MSFKEQKNYVRDSNDNPLEFTEDKTSSVYDVLVLIMWAEDLFLSK